ncbi:hypothetical protein NE237_023421 [Protea cynaroides]|uniref:DUF4408 domain-containing protein n=1 Tax=Protea cynaroides TaxID=273540 RepID=A0A9Q0K5D7_9MAGN|nr:hypothetical protein NE237_023421 [Protea cynaroides]
MDCFDFDNVKAEKEKAMQRYRRLRKMTNLFRCVEVCVALVLLSWFSTRLPVAVRISGEYFQELCLVLVSPRFVFLAGNVIILTLFAKSGQFSAMGFSPKTSGRDDLYDQFIKNNTDALSRQKSRVDDNPAPAPTPEELVYEDEETVDQEEIVRAFDNAYQEEEQVASSDSRVIYQRSQSENLKTENNEEYNRELRRSETEKYRIVGREAEEAAVAYAEDKMTIDEFHRKVEAFIAKHQMFQREESMAIVLPNYS